MAKFVPTDQAESIKIDLDDLLDWITDHVYDATHLGGITGQPEWVVGVFDIDNEDMLLDYLRDKAGMTDDQMKARYDAARVRVHGPNVDGGR